MIPPIASLAGFQIKKMFRIIGAVFSFVVIITLIFNLFFLISSPETNKRRIQAEQDTKKMREEMNRLVYSNQEDLDEDQKIVAGMYSSIMCNMTGDLCEPNQKVRYKENTVASKISDMVAIPFRNPPASGVYWVRDTLENASFIPKTYAQGMGFASLTSFQTIWKAMRDITFLGLVIIIVVIGFIVMFNVPVGGKSSVTIEAMLPRLVITLLFISFSYAIAGFLIDLMNIAMVLVVALFAPLTQGSQSDYLNSALSGQPYNMFYLTWWAPIANGEIWDASRALYDLIPSGIRYSIDSIVYYGLGHILLLSATAGLANGYPVTGKLKTSAARVGSFISKTQNPITWQLITKISSLKDSIDKAMKAAGDTGAEASGGWNFIFRADGTLKFGAGLIILMIQLLLVEPIMAVFRSYFTLALIFMLLAIALIFMFVKLFFKLFTTYVDIILSIMFAPIYIVLNALPGSNAFTDWIKQLAINLLTFPIVMGLLMVVGYMTQFAGTAEMWTPPFLTGLASQRAIQILVAGTILFNIPSFVDKAREMLGYKKGFSMSPLTMLSPWIALAGGTVGLAKSSQALNATWKKAGGIFGQATKATGAGTGGDGI